MTIPDDRDNLSHTARVLISSETLAKGKKTLTQTERRQLRYQAIMSYIMSQPAGDHIMLREFGRVIHNKADNQVHAIVKRMIKDKLITRYEITPKKYSYAVVNDPGTVITKPRSMPVVEPDVVPVEPVVESAVAPDTSADAIKQKAMEYYWEQDQFSSDRNDLRKFIGWLYDREKSNNNIIE